MGNGIPTGMGQASYNLISVLTPKKRGFLVNGFWLTVLERPEVLRLTRPEVRSLDGVKKRCLLNN